MKLSTLLLSTAALVVAGSAYAADLPAKKAAPAAKAATGCSAFGSGFFSLPGTDTCLKVGGYVRSNNTMTLSSVTRGTAPYSFGWDYDIGFDARSNTEIGAVRGFTDFWSTSSTSTAPYNGYIYVQAGGFTFGRQDSLTDIGWERLNGNWANTETQGGIRYDASVGSTTVSVAAVNAATTNNGVTSGRPDLLLGVATSAGPISANVVAVSHEAAGSASGSANAYALLSRLKFSAGPVAASVHASYANGAVNYINTGTYNSTTFAIDDTTSTKESARCSFPAQKCA